MNHPYADTTESLRAYPNVTAAARILDVSTSTLSRRADLAAERRGQRDLVLAATEVLRLGAIYRKRSLNDVAQDLLEHAAEAGVGEQRRVEEEIEAFFEETSTAAQRDDLLRLARRMLPPELYEQVEKSLNREAPETPDGIEGYVPMPED